MGKFLGRLSSAQFADKKTAQQQLLALEPQHDFLVCYDMDGHIVPNMTGKQVLVFHPHFMDTFGLRAIESFYRLHAEHHNLWSTTRGCDRHEAQAYTARSLLADPELAGQLDPVLATHLDGIAKSFERYVAHIKDTGGAYSLSSLFEFAKETGDPNLIWAVGWSNAVDRTFPFVTIPMKPFAGVRDVLDYVAGKADVGIISKTPYDDLCNYLEHHGLVDFVTFVAGKEMGGKDEHICVATGGGYNTDARRVTRIGNRYPASHVIMGGDGKGDWKAADANQAYFFPTPPGEEEAAWAGAKDGVFDPFFRGEYGDLQQARLEAFCAAMLETGPWEEPGYDHAAAYKRLQLERVKLYKEVCPGGKLLVLE